MALEPSRTHISYSDDRVIVRIPHERSTDEEIHPAVISVRPRAPADMEDRLSMLLDLLDALTDRVDFLEALTHSECSPEPGLN